MTIDEVYQIVLYATAKNKSQGYVSPQDFNNTINQAQKSYVSYILGSFQSYTPGRPISRVEFGQNTTIRTRLTPIIYWSSNGYSAYPEDYLQVDAMLTNDYKRIRVVQQDSLYSYYNSVIDPIATNPIYILENTNFRFFPNSIGTVRLSYVANPPDMVWAYTLNNNGIPIYTTGIQGVDVVTGTLSGGVITGIIITNPGSGYTGTTPTMTFTGVGGTGATFSTPIISVNPVWDDATILEIIVRALAIIGVNLQLNTVEQYSMNIKNQGQ